MTFDLTKVKQVYQDAVARINTQLGVTITLTYLKQTMSPTTNNSVGPYGMQNYDVNGSPTQISEFPGRFESSESSSFQQDTYTETIVARVYWDEDIKKIAHIISAASPQLTDKICRIVCQKNDAIKLQQCSSISIEKDGQIVHLKAIVSKTPILYGLGENTSSGIVYCVVA